MGWEFLLSTITSIFTVGCFGVPPTQAVPPMEMTLLCQTISDLLAVGALGEDLGAFQMVLELLHRHADFLLLPGNMEILMNIQTTLNHTIDISPPAYDFFVRENLYNMELVPYLEHIAKMPDGVKLFETYFSHVMLYTIFGSLVSASTRALLERFFRK